MHKVSHSLRSTHSRDGAIVLDIAQGQMFSLNLVGSRILELLEANTPEPVIADQISGEFGVTRDVVDRDLQDFVRTLLQRQLVEEVE